MGYTPTFSQTDIKYAGRPLEQHSRANQILSNRYKANKSAYENNVDFLNDMEVEDRNRGIVNDQIESTKQAFSDVISSNDFEHSGSVVSEQARALKSNRALKGAIQSQAAHSAYTSDLDARVKGGDIDNNTASRLRAEANATNNRAITVDEDGNINNVFSASTVVNDPNINKQLTDLTKTLKASKEVIHTKNGGTLHHEGGAWKASWTNESINEKEAIGHISQMIQQDPKNQAWFAQKKRLADLDKYAVGEDGTFARNPDGTLVEQYVDYKNKAAGIGYGDEAIQAYVEQYNKVFDTNPINMSKMTPSEKNQFYKTLYDSQYIPSQVNQMATAAVGVVDYDKQEVKHYQDQMIMFRAKEAYKKKAIEEAKRNNPTVSLDMINSQSLISRDAGALLANNTLYKTQLDNGVAQMQQRATAAGIEGKVIYDEKSGIVYLKKGNNKVKITDVKNGLAIQDFAKNTLAESAFRYKQNQDIVNSVFADMSAEDKAAMNKRVAEEVTELGAFDLFNDLPDDIINNLIDNKLITYNSKDELTGRIANSVNSLTGLTILKGNDDATLLRPASEIIAHLQQSQAGKSAVNKYFTEELEDDNSVFTQRLNARLAEMHDQASNYVDEGRIITEKNDRLYTITQAKLSKQRLVDTEGKSIAEGVSQVTSTMVDALLASKDITPIVLFKAGQPKMAYTGTIEVGDSDNPQMKKITVIDNNVDPSILAAYTNTPEQNEMAYSSALSTFENNEGFFEIALDVGQPNKMTVARIGLDAHNEFTNDINQTKNTVYQMTDPVTGNKLLAYDLIDAKNQVVGYKNWVDDWRAAEAAKAAKKAKK